MSTMSDAQYKKFRRTIEAEYHRNIAALDQLYRVGRTSPENLRSISPRGSFSSTSSSTSSLPSTERVKGALVKAIRGLLEDWPSDQYVTVSTIEQGLHSQYANVVVGVRRQSIANALRRMVGKKRLILTKNGKGRSEAQYRINKNGREFEDDPKSREPEESSYAAEPESDVPF